MPSPCVSAIARGLALATRPAHQTTVSPGSLESRIGSATKPETFILAQASPTTLALCCRPLSGSRKGNPCLIRAAKASNQAASPTGCDSPTYPRISFRQLAAQPCCPGASLLCLPGLPHARPYLKPLSLQLRLSTALFGALSPFLPSGSRHVVHGKPGFRVDRRAPATSKRGSTGCTSSQPQSCSKLTGFGRGVRGVAGFWRAVGGSRCSDQQAGHAALSEPQGPGPCQGSSWAGAGSGEARVRRRLGCSGQAVDFDLYWFRRHNASRVRCSAGSHPRAMDSAEMANPLPEAELCRSEAHCVTPGELGNADGLARWLAERLPAGRAQLETWGRAPGTKRVANLWAELVDGEISLEDAHPPKRTVHVASVRIQNGAGEVLVESHQEMANGEVRVRNRPLSEKMKAGEEVAAACARGILEELGAHLGARERVTLHLETYCREEQERDSFSYPGLLTHYVLHTMGAHVAHLPAGEFSTEEEEHGSFGAPGCAGVLEGLTSASAIGPARVQGRAGGSSTSGDGAAVEAGTSGSGAVHAGAKVGTTDGVSGQADASRGELAREAGGGQAGGGAEPGEGERKCEVAVGVRRHFWVWRADANTSV